MNRLATLPAAAGVDAVLAAVERDGAVIIDGVLSDAQVRQVVTETRPFVEATPFGKGFTGELTTRTGALAARSPACRACIVDPLVLAAVRRFLAPWCERIQLHLTQLIRITPGQGAQYLHRDRQAWGTVMPMSIEPQLNTIWALTDFTEANGATRVVAGSHRWPPEQTAEPADTQPAEMARGSVLVYSGSVIHGGGANVSEQERWGLNITYSLGWLRQEENMFLSCPPHIARTLDPELQELLGYTMGSTACGYFSEPLPAGQARELCPPEFALGRKPRPGLGFGVVEAAD